MACHSCMQADLYVSLDHTAPSCMCQQPETLLCRVTTGILEYFVGLFAGIFQALVLIIYQRLVDPAPPDSW